MRDKTVRRVVIKKGEKLVCPLCRRVLGEFKRDKYAWEIIKTGDIEWYGRAWKNGDYMVCPYCGFPVGVTVFNDAGIVHTGHGWMPKLYDDYVIMILIRDALLRWGMWRGEWEEVFHERLQELREKCQKS